MKFYLEYQDEKTNKYWSVIVQDNNIVVSYGKIGTQGKPKLTSFNSPAEALKDARKQAKSKIKKGYVDKSLEHFGNVEELPKEVKDDGKIKPWHSAQYWNSWNIDMDFSLEELRNPDSKKIKSEPQSEGAEMPEEVVSALEWKLDDYGREKKVNKLIQTLNKLYTGNVNAERMQKILNRTLWKTFSSHWSISKDHLEIMQILLDLGAVLDAKVEKFILNASETEIIKIQDRSIRPEYDNHFKLANISIFKRYFALGSQPQKFLECADCYFKEVFEEATDIAERLIRKTVEAIKSGGDEKLKIPAYKFTPEMNGFKLSVLDDDFYIYPDVFQNNSWFKEYFIKTDEIFRDILLEYFSPLLEKRLDKLIDEGLFDGITNGKLEFILGGIGGIRKKIISKVIDKELFEKTLRDIIPQIEQIESSVDWEYNAVMLKHVLIPALNIKYDPKRLLKIILANLYSGNHNAEDEAHDLLRDYKDKLGAEWKYEFMLYYYRNFRFEWPKIHIKELSEEYQPAKEFLVEFEKDGIKYNENDNDDDVDDDHFITSYTSKEMFIETDYIIARADDSGHIRLRFKEESEKAYSEALDFINNLTFKGYSKKYKGLQFSIYFVAEPISDYAPDAFFSKAAQYPSLHEKLEFYVNSVMYDYDHYLDEDAEDSGVIGTYAAKKLILADPKNLHLAIKMAHATDGEHEKHAYYFTYDVIKRYGVNAESVPAIYELSLTCDHEGPNLPPEIYTNTDNVQALINYINGNTHYSRGGHFLRFIRYMFDSDYKKALSKIKKLYDLAQTVKDKNIYADFYNLALSIILDPRENYNLRGSKTIPDFGAPLEGVTSNLTRLIEDRLPDQSCIITRKEANDRGIKFDDNLHYKGKAIIVLTYLGETNPEIVQFNLENRDKLGRLNSKTTYPRYIAYSNEWAMFFDDKWALDLTKTEYRDGIVFYDGKNKPTIIYGLFDYASIVQGVGNKVLNLEKILELCSQYEKFEVQKGQFYIDNPAIEYIFQGYQSVYQDRYYRALMAIDKVDPQKEPEVYEYAKALKMAILNIKKKIILELED